MYYWLVGFGCYVLGCLSVFLVAYIFVKVQEKKKKEQTKQKEYRKELK